jgi:hypothetical protein
MQSTFVLCVLRMPQALDKKDKLQQMVFVELSFVT